MNNQKQETSMKRAIMMNMFWALFSLLINTLMNFLITPYVTNNIGVEAYGFVALANTFISYVDVISVSLNAYAGRFISVAYHKGQKEEANRYFSSTIVADAVLGGTVFLLGIAMILKITWFCKIPQELVPDVKRLFFLVLLRYIMVVMRTAFETAAFIADRIDITERLQSGAYLLQAGILLFVCLNWFPHVWYVGLASMSAALFLLLANVAVSRKLLPDLRFGRDKWSPGAIWEIVSTGIWTSINNLGNVLNNGLDLWITNRMLDAVVLGQISVVKTIAFLSNSVIMKVSSSFKPRLLMLYAEKRMSQLTELLKKAMRCTGFFEAMVIGLFSVSGYDFFRIWLPGQNTKFIFWGAMIVLASDLVPGTVNPLYYVYTLTKRLKVPSIVTILMGVANVISMILLLKWTSAGGYAVLLTTLVINGVHFFDAPLYAAHCLGLSKKEFYPTIIRNVLSAVTVTGIGHFLRLHWPFVSTWMGLFLKTCLAGVILMPLLCVLLFPASDLTLVDGQPLVWISKMKGNTPIREKISGSDLVPELLDELSRENRSVFILGGLGDTAKKAAKKVKKHYPGMSIAGTYAPPLGFEKDAKEIEKINHLVAKTHPDLLLACFGCPKQEKWIYENYKKCGAIVSVCAGATVDFLAGNIKRAPRWISQCGLEWFYRFLKEPRRLFKRYFIDDMGIVKLVWKYRSL